MTKVSNKKETGQIRTEYLSSFPDTEEIQEALLAEKARRRFGRSVRSIVFILVVAAAAAVLIAVTVLPIMRIYGKSMENTLSSGDVVLSVKTSDFKTGDIVAFYYNNNILVKRVIAGSGDWVNMDKEGTVTVNNKVLEEPYLTSRAYGDVNIRLPYQVPEGKLFVMGDNRAVSVDSRNSAVGCVASEQIVGKIVFRVWPLNKIGPIHS